MSDNDKCKCHKCGKEYPARLFFTCPFCYVAEAEASTTPNNCSECCFDDNCNLDHNGDCARG